MSFVEYLRDVGSVAVPWPVCLWANCCLWHVILLSKPCRQHHKMMLKSLNSAHDTVETCATLACTVSCHECLRLPALLYRPDSLPLAPLQKCSIFLAAD